MKKMALVLMMVLFATAAHAGVIYDIQINGLYTPGDIVTVPSATVTAAAYNGVWVAEAPYGMGNGIWVYLGDHTFVPGDILEITAEYTEYYDLSELDAGGWVDDPPTAFVTLLGTEDVPAPLYMTAADIMADPEPYEGNLVFLTDGFQVTEMLSYGEWLAAVFGDGVVVHFDDVMFDESVLDVGVCYDNVVGPWHFSFGAYKLLPLEDGLTVVDCTVDNETVDFGAVKAMYR